MDYYDYSTSTYAASSDVGAVAVVIWLFVILIVMAVSILMIIAMWRIFTKAGKPGWASLVPIYNMVVMMQIVGRPEWQVVLMFLPFAHIYISIVLPLDLAKSFGKTTGFGVLMIFFPAIMYPILALAQAGMFARLCGSNQSTASRRSLGITHRSQLTDNRNNQ